MEPKLRLLYHNMKSHKGFRLPYLDLTSAHSKGQGEGHVHFGSECLEMVTDRANIIIAIRYKVIYALLIGIFTFDFDPFKGSSKGHAHFDCEYLAGRGNIAIAII